MESLGRHITDQELDLLQQLSEPACLPTTSREFANLKNLGLVMLEDKSGLVTLTPLGKAWVRTQDRWGPHS